MGSGDGFDVFVSYAHSDSAAAAELNGWLAARNLRTFFDRRELRPGLRWLPALEDAIGRSRAVAILVGRHGIGNTQQYERELALIRQTGDPNFPVIPVLMPGCESPPTGFLQLLNWIDFRNGPGVLQQPASLAALGAALRGETGDALALRASICPFRGLEPFREEDAAFFSGRDDAIRDLAARLQEHTFVAVVGPSGSGKSSLVFAGLVPALRLQRRMMWDVLTLRPGKSPLRALAEAFAEPPPDAGPAQVHNFLEREAQEYRDGAADVLAGMVDHRLDAAPEKPDRLLIYVDQWEELYAMAPAPEEKERAAQHSADVEKFIRLLVAAAERSRASVVLTVRADFYNPLIANPLLSALLPRQQVNIPPMRREDLRAAIETPAKLAGLSFAPSQLVDRILDDVGLEVGRLPLLQFALKETWERREGDRLTAEAYTEVGGVAGAIRKTAQDAYDELTPALKDAARRLFLSLVTPGEGQDDTRASTLIPEDSQQREVINLFANRKTRLLVTGFARRRGAGETDSDVRATVEVAHEALIQRWPMLRAWVNDNREKLRDREAILRAKREWEEKREEDRFLLDPGVQLDRGRALLETPGDVPVDDLRDYVGRSMAKDERRLDAAQEAKLADERRIFAAERNARKAAERTAAEEKKAAAARKRTAQVAIGGFVAALLVAGFAYWQFLQANEAKKDALAQRDVAVKSQEAAKSAEEMAVTELGRATQAEDLADKEKREAQANADLAKASAERARTILQEAQATQPRFLADEARQQRTSGDAGAAVLLALEALPDAEGARPYVPRAELQLDGALRDLRERVVLSDTDAVISAAFSSDGKRIVTAPGGNTARIWDAASGKPIGEPLKGHDGVVRSAAFSPDGKRIVTPSRDRTARIWDAASGASIGEPLIGHSSDVISHRDAGAGRHADLLAFEVLRRLHDGLWPQHDLLGAADVGHRHEVAHIDAFFPQDASDVRRLAGQQDLAASRKAGRIRPAHDPFDRDIQSLVLEESFLGSQSNRRRFLRVAHRPEVQFRNLGGCLRSL